MSYMRDVLRWNTLYIKYLEANSYKFHRSRIVQRKWLSPTGMLCLIILYTQKVYIAQGSKPLKHANEQFNRLIESLHIYFNTTKFVGIYQIVRKNPLISKCLMLIYD